MTLIEKQFGEKCEVVFSVIEEEQSQIADIRNGMVTHRNVGESDNNIGLEVTPGALVGGDRFNYITTIRDGKILRSSTVYIRDREERPVASVTVNLDITDTLQMEGFLRQFNQFEQDHSDSDAIAVSDVNGLLDWLIHKGQQKIGKPVDKMTKAEKVEFIHYLDEKGAFLITKSGEKICELFEISKFTFYSYLEKSRNVGETEEE